MERVAKVQDSPGESTLCRRANVLAKRNVGSDCPEAEATYIISAGGIDDAEKA